MEQDNTIGRRLKEIRTWRRLSLRTVAELAGMSAGHLSNIEHGKRRVGQKINSGSAGRCAEHRSL